VKALRKTQTRQQGGVWWECLLMGFLAERSKPYIYERTGCLESYTTGVWMKRVARFGKRVDLANARGTLALERESKVWSNASSESKRTGAGAGKWEERS